MRKYRYYQSHKHDLTNAARLTLSLLLCAMLLQCSPSEQQEQAADTSNAIAVSEIESSPVLPLRPNILWLVAEDLSPIIPPFGDNTVATPNLTRLANEGIRYTHVFSPSGVCAPSRAALATGMYPGRIGAQHMRTNNNAPMPEGVPAYEALPGAEVKMHSEYFRRAGYYTSNNAKEDYQFNKPVTAWDESSREAHWRNREPGQPFFSIFNFGITHESQVWTQADNPLRIAEDLDVPIPPYLPDTPLAVDDVRTVYSNIVRMDEQVGNILQQLEEDGLLDNTIIFWYADHGGPLPRQKRLLYDSGMHVPMIVRFPDQWRAGETDDQLISFVDFKSTILSLAGIEPPAYADGRAFLGEYANSPQRDYVHGAADRFDKQYNAVRAVRDHRFKYLRNLNTEISYYIPVAYRERMAIMQELLRLRDAGELNEYQMQWFREQRATEELFDTEVDPFELNNIAADPAYQGKLEELRAEADRWMAEIEDKGLIPETDYVASIWPDLEQPESMPVEFSRTGERVSLTSATDGASIAYQVIAADAELSDTWQVYTQPIALPEDQIIVASAHRIGFKPSEPTQFSRRILQLGL